MTQRTPIAVSSEQAKQIGRIAEDVALEHEGGSTKAELAKFSPDSGERLLALIACERKLESLLVQYGPWVTVQLGTRPGILVLEKEIDARDDLGISPGARHVLKKVSVASRPTDLDLYVVSASDLGFTIRDTRRDVIFAAAEKLGFYPVPAEVGPQLMLQLDDKSAVGEGVVVASEPILGSGRIPDIFAIRQHGGGLLLDAYCGYASNKWRPRRRCLFCRK